MVKYAWIKSGLLPLSVLSISKRVYTGHSFYQTVYYLTTNVYKVIVIQQVHSTLKWQFQTYRWIIIQKYYSYMADSMCVKSCVVILLHIH